MTNRHLLLILGLQLVTLSEITDGKNNTKSWIYWTMSMIALISVWFVD